MKANGLLSMIASHFIMRDVLIRYNKGERIRLTHEIVFEVNEASVLHHLLECVQRFTSSMHFAFAAFSSVEYGKLLGIILLGIHEHMDG